MLTLTSKQNIIYTILNNKCLKNGFPLDKLKNTYL